MKYALVNGRKMHAKDVQSGSLGRDLWYTAYEVKACVGKYRQYWVYTSDRPTLPQGYEQETEWHAKWKQAIIDDHCEVVCGQNREHRADIFTKKHVIEIQKSKIDGWAVLERINFYKNLTGNRLVWIVNIERPWKEKRITTELVKGDRFTIDWKYKWKWVDDIAGTNNTFLFLEVNHRSQNLIYAWKHKGVLYGKWAKKIDFFKSYLLPVAKNQFESQPKRFVDMITCEEK